jgi:hypothetical protein
VYLPVFRYPFVALDDGLHVYANPFLNPITRSHLAALWLHPYCGLYAPIAYMCFAGISAIARMGHGIATPEGTITNLDPHVFHMVNVLIHIANTVLVYRIVRRFVSGNTPAAIGAAIFALHPMQVESVAWISELRGLLGTLFGLSAVTVYLGWIDMPRKRSIRGIGIYTAALALFVLAILSKPSVVVIPFVAWLLSTATTPIGRRLATLSLIPWCGAAAMMMWATNSVQPPGPWAVPATLRPLIASDALAFYTAKVLMPIHLALVYGRTPHFVLHEWTTRIVWLVPIAFAVAIAYLWRVRPVVARGLLVFVLCLAPTLGLVPFLYQYFSTVADRYVYLAMLGPALIAADLMEKCPRPSSRIFAVAIPVFALFSLLQVHVWTDSRTLLDHSLAIFPASAPIQDDYAAVLRADGDLDGAEKHYEAAIEADPHFAAPYMHLEKLLLTEGRQPDAERLYQKWRIAAARGPIVAASLADCPFDPNRS